MPRKNVIRQIPPRPGFGQITAHLLPAQAALAHISDRRMPALCAEKQIVSIVAPRHPSADDPFALAVLRGSEIAVNMGGVDEVSAERGVRVHEFPCLIFRASAAEIGRSKADHRYLIAAKGLLSHDLPPE